MKNKIQTFFSWVAPGLSTFALLLYKNKLSFFLWACFDDRRFQNQLYQHLFHALLWFVSGVCDPEPAPAVVRGRETDGALARSQRSRHFDIGTLILHSVTHSTHYHPQLGITVLTVQSCVHIAVSSHCLLSGNCLDFCTSRFSTERWKRNVFGVGAGGIKGSYETFWGMADVLGNL